MIGGSEGWWLDTSATCHVYHDLSFFKNYNETKGRKLLLRDHHTTKVAEINEEKLKFTIGKTVIQKKVLHTRENWKNLVSIYLLNKASFTQTIKANLFTLTKNNIFVRKGATN